MHRNMKHSSVRRHFASVAKLGLTALSLAALAQTALALPALALPALAQAGTQVGGGSGSSGGGTTGGSIGGTGTVRGGTVVGGVIRPVDPPSPTVEFNLLFYTDLLEPIPSQLLSIDDGQASTPYTADGNAFLSVGIVDRDSSHSIRLDPTPTPGGETLEQEFLLSPETISATADTTTFQYFWPEVRDVVIDTQNEALNDGHTSRWYVRDDIQSGPVYLSAKTAYLVTDDIINNYLRYWALPTDDGYRQGFLLRVEPGNPVGPVDLKLDINPTGHGYTGTPFVTSLYVGSGGGTPMTANVTAYSPETLSTTTGGGFSVQVFNHPTVRVHMSSQGASLAPGDYVFLLSDPNGPSGLVQAPQSGPFFGPVATQELYVPRLPLQPLESGNGSCTPSVPSCPASGSCTITLSGHYSVCNDKPSSPQVYPKSAVKCYPDGTEIEEEVELEQSGGASITLNGEVVTIEADGRVKKKTRETIKKTAGGTNGECFQSFGCFWILTKNCRVCEQKGFEAFLDWLAPGHYHHWVWRDFACGTEEHDILASCTY